MRWIRKRLIVWLTLCALVAVTITWVLGTIRNTETELRSEPIFDGRDGFSPPLRLDWVRRSFIQFRHPGSVIPGLAIKIHESWSTPTAASPRWVEVVRLRFSKQGYAVQFPITNPLSLHSKPPPVWDPVPTIGTHTAWLTPSCVLFVKGTSLIRVETPYDANNPSMRSYTEKVANLIYNKP